MRNPATTIDDEERNEATQLISSDPKHPTMVKMRNGNIIEVYFSPAESELESDVIRDVPYNYCWHSSGKSVTRDDYDIIEVLV